MGGWPVCVWRRDGAAADGVRIPIGGISMAVIRHGRKTNFAARPWLGDLVARKPAKVAAVALANRIARTAWVVLAKGETYRPPATTAA